MAKTLSYVNVFVGHDVRDPKGPKHATAYFEADGVTLRCRDPKVPGLLSILVPKQGKRDGKWYKGTATRVLVEYGNVKAGDTVLFADILGVEVPKPIAVSAFEVSEEEKANAKVEKAKDESKDEPKVEPETEDDL